MALTDKPPVLPGPTLVGARLACEPAPETSGISSLSILPLHPLSQRYQVGEVACHLLWMPLVYLFTSEMEENESMGWRGWSLPVFLSPLVEGSSHWS